MTADNVVTASAVLTAGAVAVAAVAFCALLLEVGP